MICKQVYMYMTVHVDLIVYMYTWHLLLKHIAMFYRTVYFILH